jgi:hypothetical protein
MTLSRNLFFLLLLALGLMPLFVIKLVWLAGSEKASGTMCFVGHGNLGSVLGISTYPVIEFKTGKDSFSFNGNVNIPFKNGEIVPVRYQRDNPVDAKINLFTCIWGDTLAYELTPFLILMVIFFHPDLIPRKAKISMGRQKPYIKLVAAD